MNDKIEEFKNEIDRLKKLHLKTIKNNSDLNHFRILSEKSKQVENITKSLSEYLKSLEFQKMDKKTQDEINKIYNSEIIKITNSIYS